MDKPKKTITKINDIIEKVILNLDQLFEKAMTLMIVWLKKKK